MNELYDVIVVGAGPSGCMASYTATKLGLNVLLIEKEKIPGNSAKKAARQFF